MPVGRSFRAVLIAVLAAGAARRGAVRRVRRLPEGRAVRDA